MTGNYFHIGIFIKGRAKPMIGVRKYLTGDVDEVYEGVINKLLKYCQKNDIMKIDVWILSQESPELKSFLTNAKTTISS